MGKCLRAVQIRRGIKQTNFCIFVGSGLRAVQIRRGIKLLTDLYFFL